MSAKPPTIPGTTKYKSTEITDTLKCKNIIVNTIEFAGTFMRNTEPVTISSPQGITYTAQDISQGLIIRTSQLENQTDTLPTAQSIIELISNPPKNSYFSLLYNNKNTSNTISIASNTGLTLVNSIPIYPTKSIYIIFFLSSVDPGSEQIYVYFMDDSSLSFPLESAVNHSIFSWNGISGDSINNSSITVSDTGIISNIADPLTSTDASNKKYVDEQIQGVHWKESVVCVTTNAVGLSGSTPSANTDGVTPTSGDRVLVVDQFLPVENGVYIYNSTGPWTRASDLPLGTSASGFAYSVQKGTLYAETAFICTSDPPNDIVGTSPLSFSLFSQIIQVQNGLTKVNNTINLNVDNTTMKVDTLTNKLVCNLCPVGTVIQSVSNNIPGYLLCDGASYDRITYSTLYQNLNISLGSVTITIANPAIVTLNGHGLFTGQIVYFTTSGTLPTGITADTSYYVSVLTGNTFRLSTSYTNLQNNIYVVTSGAQSGTHVVVRSIGGVSNSTTFNVPNLTKTCIAGVSSTHGISQLAGNESVTLSVANLPQHSHTFTLLPHTHTTPKDEYNKYSINSSTSNYIGILDTSRDYTRGITDNGAVSNTYTTTNNTQPTGTTSPYGTSTPSPMSIIQPTIFMYLHIKY